METRENELLQQDQAAKIKSDVQKRGAGEKSRVKVTLQNKTELKGYISEIDANSFQVTEKKSGKVRTIAYEDALKIRKDGLPTAAKIAIGTGAVAGTMMVVGLIAYKAAGY